MVMRLMLLLLVVNSTVTLAASLRVELSKKVIEHGRYLSVDTLYEGSSLPNPLSLNAWAPYFFIEAQPRQIKDDNERGYLVSQRLKLFPKRSGVLHLGPLALGGARSESQQITVTPAIIEGVDITPIWAPLPERIWQGERFNTCVSASLSDARNNVKVEQPEFSAFSVRSLGQRVDSSQKITTADECWELSAREPGEHTLALPSIIQRGRGRWVFYLPPQTLEVLPLPSYLPSNIALGAPLIETRVVGDHWAISASTTTQSNDRIYGIKTALQTATGVLAEHISVQEDAFLVPLPTWSIGRSLPVSVPYFDTQEGRLNHVVVELPKVVNLPIYAQIVLWALGLCAVCWGVYLFKRHLNKRAWKRMIQQQLMHAQSVDDLRSILFKHTQPKGRHTPYVTLSEWVEHPDHPIPLSTLNALNSGSFARLPTEEFNRLKTTLASYYR